MARRKERVRRREKRVVEKEMCIRDSRNRILYTIGLLIVFRAGVAVPVPGIIPEVIAGLFQEGTLFSFMDLFSGGALRNYSVFAMSIYPYINSSIIMQLLTMVIPKWEEMSKDEDGREKLQDYTRYGTVILGLIQATGMTLGIRAQGALVSTSVWVLIEAILSLTAGTAFLMWLGELITEKGIGNGISLFIFGGIVSGIPREIGSLYVLLKMGQTRWYNVLALLAITLVTLVLVIWITEGERRIPVQYSKRVVGRKMMGGYSTHIPIRINQAGVIPVSYTHLDVYKRQLPASPARRIRAIPPTAPRWKAVACRPRRWTSAHTGNISFATPFRLCGCLLRQFVCAINDGFECLRFRTGNRPQQEVLAVAHNRQLRAGSEFEAVSYTHLDVYKRQPPAQL